MTTDSPTYRRSIPKLSLFFFSDVTRGSSSSQYQQLIRMAQLADDQHLHAIWTPERHFHSFGGMFPNPSVLSAALAASTRQICIRAGSVVLPLHDPIRVAEEWALVDNLSQGRAGIAFAAGWQRNDFVLNAANYKKRHQRLFTALEQIQSLWRGQSICREELSLPDNPEPIEIQTWPAPFQSNIPIWITAGSNPALFIEAGKRGLNVLTHFISQTREQLHESCRLYRQSRAQAGMDPTTGKITLMMHAQIGLSKQEMLPQLRPAMSGYLSAFMQLSDNLSQPYKTQREDNTKRQAYKLKWGVEKYLNQYGLFGSPDECKRQLVEIREEGIDEVACLIDFGMAEESVITTINTLGTLVNKDIT